MNTQEKVLKIYEIKHPAFRVPIKVVGDSLSEAVDNFKNYYDSDYDVDVNNIEGINLTFEDDVII